MLRVLCIWRLWDALEETRWGIVWGPIVTVLEQTLGYGVGRVCPENRIAGYSCSYGEFRKVIAIDRHSSPLQNRIVDYFINEWSLMQFVLFDVWLEHNVVIDDSWSKMKAVRLWLLVTRLHQRRHSETSSGRIGELAICYCPLINHSWECSLRCINQKVCLSSVNKSPIGEWCAVRAVDLLHGIGRLYFAKGLLVQPRCLEICRIQLLDYHPAKFFRRRYLAIFTSTVYTGHRRTPHKQKVRVFPKYFIRRRAIVISLRDV